MQFIFCEDLVFIRIAFDEMLLKFLFDRIVALLGLVLLWPMLLVVAVLIRIKMPDGPVLFRKVRVGQNGRLFTM